MMFQQIIINSKRDFSFREYESVLGMNDLVLAISPKYVPNAWGFYRKEKSNTMFIIEHVDDDYILSMDSIATYDDYRLLPYLIDTLSTYLCDAPYTLDGTGAFDIFNEDWIEETIGEEVAYIKCMLSEGYRYYIELPVRRHYPYINEKTLNDCGVTLHSSTPRIYGYICHLLKHNLLPFNKEREVFYIDDIYVDVPQHDSIGSVRSWLTDGTETAESYSKEDVELLVTLGQEYKEGKQVIGVVLNDIGTIYENAIGVERNAELAVYWYKEAIRQGDRLYAPTSLGDIYRRGLDEIKQNLSLALEAYRISEDPYSWYRIGQSYEEGWTEEPNIHKAMKWYHKAASVGHHLALKRLECEDEN